MSSTSHLYSWAWTYLLKGTLHGTSRHFTQGEWEKKILTKNTLRLRKKWPPFWRCHFLIKFLVWKLLWLISNFLLRVQLNKPVLLQRMAWVPNKQQAIIWTNGGIVYGCIDASLGLNELNEHIVSWGIYVIEVNILITNVINFCIQSHFVKW